MLSCRAHDARSRGLVNGAAVYRSAVDGGCLRLGIRVNLMALNLEHHYDNTSLLRSRRWKSRRG